MSWQCQPLISAIGVTEMTSRLGATDWAAFVNNSEVRNQVDGTTNFTLFVPTNQAMQVHRSPYHSYNKSFKYIYIILYVGGMRVRGGGRCGDILHVL